MTSQGALMAVVLGAISFIGGLITIIILLPYGVSVALLAAPLGGSLLAMAMAALFSAPNGHDWG
jgi:hypothetical protein